MHPLEHNTSARTKTADALFQLFATHSQLLMTSLQQSIKYLKLDNVRAHTTHPLCNLLIHNILHFAKREARACSFPLGFFQPRNTF